MFLGTKTKNIMHITDLVFFKQINQRGYSIINCVCENRQKDVDEGSWFLKEKEN
jgi:hypothetical protein